MYEPNVPFETLIGKTLKEVSAKDDEILFITVDGERYRQYHSQECCERVWLEDVCGNFNDLIGLPLLMADEASDREEIDDTEDGYDYSSETWTFYKLATVKGYVTLRWYGKSNGYYSEKAQLDKLPRKEKE